MAVLNGGELNTIQQGCEKIVTVDYTKAQINTAIQAIEDWYQLNKGDISTDIDTATSPFSFSIAQKKAIFAYWAFYRFNNDK